MTLPVESLVSRLAMVLFLSEQALPNRPDKSVSSVALKNVLERLSASGPMPPFAASLPRNSQWILEVLREDASWKGREALVEMRTPEGRLNTRTFLLTTSGRQHAAQRVAELAESEKQAVMDACSRELAPKRKHKRARQRQ